MKQYRDLVRHVLLNGEKRTDRTGTGTLSVFGHQMRFDLQNGFPLVTSKFTSFRTIAHELLWMLSGNTNIKELQDNGVRIWDEWATDEGELGAIYGQQWRSWPVTTLSGVYNIDQISDVIKRIKETPDSRRLIVSAWNVAQLPLESLSPQDNVHRGRMALAPCHTLFQFYVSEGKLSCQLYQRSADIFLGLPYNIASYALLTSIIAKHCNLEVGGFIWTGGDCHLYLNHVEGARQMMKNEPYPLPSLEISHVKNIFNHFVSDFTLKNYLSHERIEGAISV